MPITCTRDTDGIAHIDADDEAGAFFGQGWASVRDRCWQMEWDRRKALGRLAEIVGAPALPSDRFHRRMGLAAAAEHDLAHLSDRTVAMLEAYASGVNAALTTADFDAPPELGLLDAPAPEPWAPWHSLAVFAVRHLAMGTADVKLWRSGIVATVGPDLAARFWSSLPGVTIDPDAVPRVSDDVADLLREADAALEGLRALHAMPASNNLVVGGARTTTGLPVMAGDPHRAIDLPNVYWQNHLRWPAADVIGLSFPGVPGFPHFGHNAHVAWSITHGMADDQDLFVETLRARDGHVESLRDGDWTEVEETTEQIAVRGRDGETVRVLVTGNGPIIAGGPERGLGLALRWTATAAPDTTLDCILPQLTADSVDSIDDAFTRWVVPCNNVLVADQNGSIAYRFRGRLAQRADGNTWTIVDGSDSSTTWRGFVPDEELVRVRDPERGFLCTANNPIGAPHHISHDWAHPARAGRLTALLADDRLWAGQDLAAVLGDTHSVVARRLAQRITEIRPQTDDQRRARSLVEDWDHHMDEDAAAAAIYAATRAELVVLLAARLGLGDLPQPDGVGYSTTLATRALHVRVGFLVDDRDLVTDDLVTDAFRAGVTRLRDELGGDPETWAWGRVHRAGFHHPLAALRPDLADRLPTPETVPLGGDNECLWAAGTIPPSLDSVTSPVARYVFDLDDWDRSAWIVPHGVAGDPRHAHHTDQLHRWAGLRLAPMRYSRDAIAAATESVAALPGHDVSDTS